ncbi:MAG: glycosyltransferase family 39 protein [Elusimicrobia bacterium]|nr:glycosyltransferase family 39 protein [Elusimicrobiota bacterium]
MKKIFFYVIFIWIVLILFCYFLKYPLPNFMERFWEILFFSIIVFISFQVGNYLLSKFSSYLNTSLNIAFSIGVGLSIFSIIIFTIGIFGILYKSLFYILFLVLLVLSLLRIHNLKKLELPKLSSNNNILYIFFIFLGIAFIGALTQPTFYDSLVYHLAIPLQYIKHHKIYNIDTNIFANFPQNIEMLYTMSLLLYDDILANLIHFLFLPLTLLLIYDFLRNIYDNEVSIFASLIFITTPAVILVSCGTYIDMGLTFYLLLGFIALLEWIKTSERKWLVLSSLLCGFSLGIKYTASISIFIFILLILYNCILTKKNVFSILTLFIIPMFFVFMPWLIKNYIFTKNPIFPFFVFGEIPLYVQKYLEHVSSHGISGSMSLITLPWDLTMNGVNFGGGFDIIGPFYLVFLPILLLIRKTNKIIKLCFFYMVIYFFLWSFSARVLRFLIPVLPIAAIVFSACIYELNIEKLFKHIVKIIFIVIIVSNLCILLFIQNYVGSALYLSGNMSKDEYLCRFINPNNYYPAVKFMNETFNSKSKTLFVGEARSYFTKYNVDNSSPFDADVFVEIANNSSKPEELWYKLKERNFTHVLWNYPEYERLKGSFRPFDFTSKSIEIINIFKEKYLKNLYENKGLYVYEIKQ